MGYSDFGKFYVLTFVGILAIELIAGRHKGVHSRDDMLVNVLCGAINNAAMRPLLSIAAALLFGLVVPGLEGCWASMPAWQAFAITLVLSEFLFYWVHRLSHTWAASPGRDWLWQLHRAHHSPRYMNVLVLLRTTPVWSIVQPQTWVIGFAFYAGHPVAAVLVGLTEFAWNAITHSHFRWDDPLRRNRWTGKAFRALEHVLVSPGIHHTHHGYGRDGANYRNFALMFSLFDWMFGTLHIPQGRPWRYGLPGRNAHWTEQVFYPLVRHTTDPKDPGAAAP